MSKSNDSGCWIIVGIVALGLIIMSIPLYIWGIIAAVLCITVATIFGYTLREEKKERQKRKEYEEAERQKRNEYEEAERQKINLLKADIYDFIRYNKLLQSFLIVDANIWMSEDYTPFFDLLADKCRQEAKTLILYGPQFDEICNIKKKTKYGKRKNSNARLAINRIDKWTLDNILRIEPITIDAKPDAYADPLIIRLLLKTAKQGKSVCLLSDDKELRVRARECIKGINDISTTIIGMDSVKDACATINKLQLPPLQHE